MRGVKSPWLYSTGKIEMDENVCRRQIIPSSERNLHWKNAPRIFFFSSRRRHTRYIGLEFRRVLFRSLPQLRRRHRQLPRLRRPDARLRVAGIGLIADGPRSNARGLFVPIGAGAVQTAGSEWCSWVRSEERRVGKEWRCGWAWERLSHR